MLKTSKAAMHVALKKWNSCPSLLQLPTSDTHVKRIHVYDFDNTLCLSPQPNRQLYTAQLLGSLYGGTLLGGRDWWSEPRFLEKHFTDMLAATGEESRAQFWNEEIVALARASFADANTASILLTGRKEELFAQLFGNTLEACGVTYFNAICLKRADVVGVQSTFDYKTKVICELIDEYEGMLEEITLYDDRMSQVTKLSNFLDTLGGSFQRTVVPVVPRYRLLDVALESRMVLEMADANTVQWTPRQNGYFLSVQSHRRLLSWTFNFFQEKYKWNVLPQYPLYIPCCGLGKSPPAEEIARVWTNNGDKDLGEDDVRRSLNLFQAQERSCEVQFNVVELGVCNRNRDSVIVFYRAQPCDRSRYLWNEFGRFVVLGFRYDSSDDPALLRRVLRGEERSAHWIKLRKPIKIKTYFGHYARLTKHNFGSGEYTSLNSSGI